MGIKLKNIKYSKVTKGIAVFLVWLCFMSTVLSIGFFLYYQEILTTDSYYETHEFVEKFSRLVHNVAEYNAKFKKENGVINFGDTQSEISKNAERYQTIKDRLADTVNFAYYVKNSETGEIITNVDASNPVALLKEQPAYVHIGGEEPDYHVYFNQRKSYYTDIYYKDDINEMLKDTSYEIHAALIEPLKRGDMFYNEFWNYSWVKSAAIYVTALLIVSIVLMIAAFIYLIYSAGRREKEGEIVLTFIDKIYTDVHTVLVFIAALISMAVVNDFSRVDNAAMLIAASIVLSIDFFIGLTYVLSMVRQIKKKQLISNSLIYKLFSSLKEFMILAFSGRMFKGWIIIVLLVYGAINGMLFMILSSTWPAGEFEFLFTGFLIMAFNAAAAYYSAKSLKNLSQIMEAAKELSRGNLDYSLDTNEMTVAFAGFAEDLQGIQRGLKKAVEEAVKGERMKTELITNVSHDLKTPLTSIINYVDLLKQEELNNDTAKNYVEILEEKSARLKQLIEDLIEASKASSGNLPINAEKVDLNQLVMQAYGEYEEKIEKAGLEIRTNFIEKDVLVYADGKHLWRIVENLMSNVLKYSMPNTRVYINIDKRDRYGVLIIKNISAFPLEISPEQLTERFVRGDAARTTEGSGLGLSIAQSLTQLQGGNFKIEIDGDLFKVTVEIPLWMES